jgi:hypothetical protein
MENNLQQHAPALTRELLFTTEWEALLAPQQVRALWQK